MSMPKSTAENHEPLEGTGGKVLEFTPRKEERTEEESIDPTDLSDREVVDFVLGYWTHPGTHTVSSEVFPEGVDTAAWQERLATACEGLAMVPNYDEADEADAALARIYLFLKATKPRGEPSHELKDARKLAQFLIDVRFADMLDPETGEFVSSPNVGRWGIVLKRANLDANRFIQRS